LRFQESPLWPRTALCLKKRDKEEKVKGGVETGSEFCDGGHEFLVLLRFPGRACSFF
jgi:hypothetical protein